jgi:UDPglucose 6-dehydrogenase
VTAPESPIAVVGSGHVGLVTAVCLAHLGHSVRCVDADPAKVERLRAGQPTIYEEGLEPLLVDGLRSGRVSFTTDLATAVAGAEFVFLCLPTWTHTDGSTDVAPLEDVCTLVAPHLSPGAVIVNKSTVPIGATAMVTRLLDRPDVAVVSVPEFLREGSAVHDSLHPTRIVVGASSDHDAQRVLALYRAL